MKKRFFYVLMALMCLLPLALFGCGPSAPSTPDDGGNENNPNTEIETIEGHEVITAEQVNSFSEEYLRLFGRTYLNGKNLILGNAATGAEITFYGTSLTATMTANPTMYCRIFVDGDTEGKRISVRASKEYKLASGLEEGVHTVRIAKANPSQNGNVTVKKFATDGKFLRPEKKERLSIEFVGDSITAGGGVLGTPSDLGNDANADATKTYAYRTVQHFDADYSIVATDGICTKANFVLPISMLDMYVSRSSTDLTPYDFPRTYDVVVVATGTNDAFYLASNNGYSGTQFTADYTELLTLIRSKNPDAKIVCVYGMMNLYPQIEQGIQDAIASFEDERMSYLPLPLGINGAAAHPNTEDAIKQADVLIEHLEKLLA